MTYLRQTVGAGVSISNTELPLNLCHHRDWAEVKYFHGRDSHSAVSLLVQERINLVLSAGRNRRARCTLPNHGEGQEVVLSIAGLHTSRQQQEVRIMSFGPPP